MGIARIDSLITHESIVPRRALSIAADIISSGVVRRPIIVDEESMTVIDGHHRLAALMMAGARYAPVVYASYRIDIERIDPPSRIVCVEAGELETVADSVIELLEESGLWGTGRSSIVIRGKEYRIGMDKYSLYLALSRIPGPRKANLCVEVRPEPFTREEVVSLALAGVRLPPKSTIHITRLKGVIAPTRLSSLL